MTAMRSQLRNKRLLAAVIVASGALGVACVLLALFSGIKTKRSAPFEVAGTWSVYDLQGQSRGTITFSADGKYDDGDYFGRWSFENGAVHVYCRSGTPTSWKDYLFPQVDHVVLSPQLDPRSGTVVLRGEFVNLTRLPEQQQSDAPAH